MDCATRRRRISITKKRHLLAAIPLLTVLLLGCYGLVQTAGAAPAGYTERLTVINNCGSNAWMWVVPPGPDVAEEQSQFWETVNGGAYVCKTSNKDKADCEAISPRNYQWKIELAKGESKTFALPDRGAVSNKVYFNLDCREREAGADYKDWGYCTIGGEFGTTLLGNEMVGSNTWFEATWGCSDPTGVNCNINPSSPTGAPLTAQDWMDISFVDGYTIPMKMELAAGEATANNCQFNNGTKWNGLEDAGFVDLASCASETAATFYTDVQAIDKLLHAPDGQISWLTQSGGNYVNCVAPHKWLQGNNLLGTKLGTPGVLPLKAGTTEETLNAVNWYGCKGLCGETAGTEDCVCPECCREACLSRPYGNGDFTVAEAAYVKRLKAMGLEAYTWQFDDDAGNKHCDQGVHVTVTLCPAQTGQKPWDPKQSWNYDAGAKKCVLAAVGAKGTYPSYFDCISKHSKYKKQVDVDNKKVVYCIPSETGEFDDYASCAAGTESAGVPLGPIWAYVALFAVLLLFGLRMARKHLRKA